MKRKRKSSQRKKKFSIHPFILFFMLILMSIPLILKSVDWFSERQILKFSTPERLLFVQSSSTVMLLVAIPIVLILCLLSFLYDKKQPSFLRVNKSVLTGFIVILVGGIFLANGFYSYAHIDQEGIKTRNGLLTKEIEYGWEYVISATTSYRVSYRRNSGNDISLHYDLQTADGRIINLYKSPDFFTHIEQTDDYLQGLGIPISRSGINSKDYDEFVTHFKGPGKLEGIDRLVVVEHILTGSRGRKND